MATAGAKRAVAAVSFKALLMYRLWAQFPAEPEDDVEARCDALMRTCKPRNPLEEAAWREALADRARIRLGPVA